MMVNLVWHGAEPTPEWRARAHEEAAYLLDTGYEIGWGPMFHDVWDNHPDDRPRIVMWGRNGDPRIHVEFLVGETRP